MKLRELKKQHKRLGEEIERLEQKPIKHIIEKQELEWGELSEERMTWQEAKEWCKNLGEGWRLPTVIELLQAYYDEVPGFGSGFLWSGTEFPLSNARLVRFSDGLVTYTNNTCYFYVRCVREL